MVCTLYIIIAANNHNFFVCHIAEGREYKEKLRLLKQENNEMRMEISGTYVHIIVFKIFHNFHYI